MSHFLASGLSLRVNIQFPAYDQFLCFQLFHSHYVPLFHPEELLEDLSMNRQTIVHYLPLLKPQGNFCVRRVHRITSMDDIPTHIDGEITSDGSWFGFQWISLPKHLSSLFHHVLTLPNHGNHWTRGNMSNETREEGFGTKIAVMQVQQNIVWMQHLQGNEFVSTLLEPLDDISDQSSFHSIRFDHDEGTFHVGWWWNGSRSMNSRQERVSIGCLVHVRSCGCSSKKSRSRSQ